MSVSSSIIVCDYSSSLSIKRYYHDHLPQSRFNSTTFALHSTGLPSLGSIRLSRKDAKRRFIVKSVVQPGVPPPSGPPFDILKCMLGVMAFVVPFFTGRWASLLKLKNEVDTTVQSIEDVVEAIEKAADGIDKAAEKIGQDLPEGGQLRKAVEFIEHAAERASKDAHFIDNIIDTVQEAEEKVEEYVAHGLHKSESGTHGPAIEATKAHESIEEIIEAHGPDQEAHESIAEIIEAHESIGEVIEAHGPEQEAHERSEEAKDAQS